MKAAEIMAVVVSFNGGIKTIRTVNALIKQVAHVHVVDNSSDQESVSLLKELRRQPEITISWLDENTGIGHALNIGINMARELGYDWLLTMDQDSIPDATMVSSFVDAVDDDPSVVCLAPQYAKQGEGESNSVRKVDYAITSGNLVRMQVYDRIGQYDEEMFIDGIDFDFSLRVRRAGFNIYLVGSARMEHELGDKACTLPLIRRVHTFHSPLRRYYIYRNYFYLLGNYAAEFPGFAFKLTVSHVAYIFTILLAGEQRLKSIWYIIYGFLDYLRNRKGPYQYK